MNESKRERAERLNEVLAELQESTMRLLLEKVKNGTATSADMKLAADMAAESGLVLNPDAFPQGLKDKLTKTVDPNKFSDGDADIIAMNWGTG